MSETRQSRRWTRRHALAAVLVGAPAATWAQETGSFEPIALAWSRPARKIIDVAVSPSGDRIATLTLDGLTTCYDRSGSTRWQRRCPGADRLALSDGGRLTAAWAEHRPLSRRLSLIDSAGKLTHAPELPTALDAVCVVRDGTRVVVASGKSVFYVGLRDGVLRQRVIAAGGRVRRLQLGPADTIYVATDDPPTVARLKSTGKELWRHRDSAAEAYTLCAAEDGSRVAVAAQEAGDILRLTLLSAKNEEQWSTTLQGAREPQIRLCARGTAVALSYDHRVQHGEQTRFERRLTFRDTSAGWQWPKGGALTAPLLVAIAAEGEWVVALDNERRPGGARFRLYGRDGGRRWIYTAPAGVHLATTSADGRTIATYRTDDTLAVLSVNIEP